MKYAPLAEELKFAKSVKNFAAKKITYSATDLADFNTTMDKMITLAEVYGENAANTIEGLIEDLEGTKNRPRGKQDAVEATLWTITRWRKNRAWVDAHSA